MYQGGLPLELVTFAPGGGVERRVLGDPEAVVRSGGHAPEAALELPVVPPESAPDRYAQALVPAGSWQGARLFGGPHLPAERAWALVSCVVTPGFEFDDFELADRGALSAACPGHEDLIRALT